MVQQPMHVVKLNAELEMLLDDVLDGHGPSDRHAARLLVLGQQHRRVAFDLLLLEVRHFLRHQVVSLSSASSNSWSADCQSSFASCACRANRAMSSAVMPLVVRRSAASWTGWRLIMSVMSVETR